MSVIVSLFSIKPQNPVGEGGRMALADHFREFRGRLMRSILAVVIAMIIAFAFHNQILSFLIAPYNDARAALGKEVVTQLTVSGIGGPFNMLLKVCCLAAIVATAPYWLYQIWAFVLPGLHPKERRYTRLFVAVAGPLFLAGITLGYLIMPKGIRVLIGFTQADFTNLVDFNEFFSFFTIMLLVFGLSFEIPLFVFLLNLMGLVKGKTLGRYRPWIVLGSFIFAAVATPSTDAFSMLLLATPMVVLFMLCEVGARVMDRVRDSRRAQARVSEVGS